MTPLSAGKDKALQPTTPTRASTSSHLPSPDKTPVPQRMSLGSPLRPGVRPGSPAGGMSEFVHYDLEGPSPSAPPKGKRREGRSISSLLNADDKDIGQGPSSRDKGKAVEPSVSLKVPDGSEDSSGHDDPQRTPRKSASISKPARTPFTPRRLLFGPAKEPRKFSPSLFRTPAGPRDLHHGVYDPYDSPAFLEDELNRLENPETSPGSFFGRRAGLLYESPIVSSKARWKDWDGSGFYEDDFV